MRCGFPLIAAALLACGCKDKLSEAAKAAQGLYAYDPAAAVHNNFSGEKAFAHVKAQVDMGPRPAGSAAVENLRRYLEDQLKAAGWETTRQEFSSYTREGTVKFANLRARFPVPESQTWKRAAAVLVGSHFDTKLFRNFKFVGANDGASSTAVLLEMARVLGAHPAAAQFVELVFFDGEEAVVDYTMDAANALPTDGLFGSRHYVEVLRKEPKDVWPACLVLLDMVGDKELMIRMPENGTANLKAAVKLAAEELGYSRHFSADGRQILDDHVPFLAAGIPAVDIIDLDFAPWHTALDTLDQVSPASLEIAGRTTLLLLEKHLLGRGQ
ncbi:MAG: M28 family peptidase [Verrucomicrobiales bacterium]|nr:M28 family peptidase [Verrucomicrobiales bacterium]